MPHTTIVIVTYNSSNIIRDCLQHCGKDYPIIIVDNNSSDNTCQIIKEEFPYIKLITSKTNNGYGRGNNIALKNVTTKYALIINPDTFISSNTVKELEKRSLKFNNLAISSTDIIFHEKRFENSDTEKNTSYINSWNKIIKNIDTNIKQVDWICGAMMLCDIKKLENVGFFDKEIFLFHDELDLCHRVNKQGFAIYVFTDLKTHHHSCSSSGKSYAISYLRGWHCGWSKLYQRKKYKGRFKASYIAPKFIIRNLICALKAFIAKDTHKAVENLASISGTTHFVLGFAAFNKHNNPRGKWHLQKKQN